MTAIENRKVDGKSFTITKLNVEDALKVLIWLTKSTGGSLAKGLGELESFKDLKDGDNVDFSKFSGVLESLFDRIDEKETIEKIEILLSCVSYETQNLHFNHPVLIGEPLLALKLAKESLGVNFKSFLDGISGLAGKLKKSVAIIQEGAK